MGEKDWKHDFPASMAALWCSDGAGPVGQATAARFAIAYGTGEVRGSVNYDVVRLGSLRLARQGLGLAAETDGGFLNAACDGLMARSSTSWLAPGST